MAGLKVFISSTCYDLSVVRSQIRMFVQDFGHEPVMSEYNDVLYDYRYHTHKNCVDEVSACDMLVLFIGSRFGGKAIPSLKDQLDLDKLKEVSRNCDFLSDSDSISITQVEVLKAVELGMPIFVFVESGVWHDHALYEKNKGKPFLKKIDFPSIQKKETATYIFEFINFLRLRSTGNSLYPFSRLGDIEDTLRRQWASLFQRLLIEDRERGLTARKVDDLSERFDDLKAAILATQGPEATVVARAVVKFRKLISFGYSLVGPEIKELLKSNLPWGSFLVGQNIKFISTEDFLEKYPDFSARRRIYGVLWFSDDTCISLHVPLEDFIEDWSDFMTQSEEVKKIVIDSLFEIGVSPMMGPISPRRSVEHFFSAYRVQSMATVN
ncbi:hypothetical protein PS903_02035 [Pseudomonas fluorescens]|nr:hypothetical protein PS903_02035 [Pseudomonas fluorescens]